LYWKQLIRKAVVCQEEGATNGCDAKRLSLTADKEYVEAGLQVNSNVEDGRLS
jgi:hypothetical protein